MDYYQAQDFFKQMHPGKNIFFGFDDKCCRVHEIVYTEGLPNVFQHLEYNKVKATVEGMEDPIYIPISPHRENCVWSHTKNLISSKEDVFIHEEYLKTLCELEDKNDPLYESCLKELTDATSLPKEKIQQKIISYRGKVNVKK